MNKTQIYCSNCGKYGHNYRRCLAPIISLGIIIFKKENGKLKYLMIQRKDTLGFVEFMRGKYNLDNVKYIHKLFEIMTIKERNLILENDFISLWNTLWLNKNNRHFHNEYDSSKEKFNTLKKGFYNKNKLVNLESINKETPEKYTGPEWGFPKGRRNLKETDIECAKREFSEETGIEEKDYTILHIKPFSESFMGTNNIRYKHIYYIAEAKETLGNDIEIDKNNFFQMSEIGNIEWVTFIDALKKIRPYNIEKKNMLDKTNKVLV